MGNSGDLLVRYGRGEHLQVWEELRRHKTLDGELLQEARAVAGETMKRVARGADLLASRLQAHGWKPLMGSLRTVPHTEDQEIMARLEQLTSAPLPISLRAFWEHVGGIDFVWDYESEARAPDFGLDLPMDELDPLFVSPPRAMNFLMEEWRHEQFGLGSPRMVTFTAELAPDYLHKANISGGLPYGIELPYSGADPIFANEPRNLPFIDYLRVCFRYAGFPGLEECEGSADVREFLRTMGADLEPF